MSKQNNQIETVPNTENHIQKIENYLHAKDFAKATPVMQQYLKVKAENQDCLVFFRMGDFFELFYEDAISACKTLGIALTKRGKNTDNEVPMCGVPHHALENYMNKLLRENYKVAICDQLETPEEAKARGGYKAVVERKVTRIITPGTVSEDGLIDEQKPNYLCSIFVASSPKNQASISLFDIATSELQIMKIDAQEITTTLSKLEPSEILMSEKLRGGDLSNYIGTNLDKLITYQVDSFFATRKCEQTIKEFYNIEAVSAIGELNNSDISSFGSILQYINITQRENSPKLQMPKIKNAGNKMAIDSASWHNLEVTISNNQLRKKNDTLFKILNKTVTSSGSRLLFKYLTSPLIDTSLINSRLDTTKLFYDNIIVCEEIRNELTKTSDLERCLSRLLLGRATPPDLLSIKHTIKIAEELQQTIVTKLEFCQDKISSYTNGLIRCGNIYDLIDSAIKEDAPNSVSEGGIIKESYNLAANDLWELIYVAEKSIEELRKKYQKITNIDSLKIASNNVIGLFIEVTQKNAKLVTDPIFMHKQSTLNCARFKTDELIKIETDLITARQKVVSIEHDIFVQTCKQVLEYKSELFNLANILAKLDVFCNFAHIAEQNNYCQPEILDNNDFLIEGGRHPVLEKNLPNQDAYIDNDCHLNDLSRIWLITGPNMAGKSTYLKQNALIAIMAQIGSFVPASRAQISVIDKVFCRIGAGDNITMGQSTFMVEMLETSAILAQSTKNSLIILDEVGRGTSTYDGVAIAWSVLEYIHNKIGAKCLFATHYHELVQMSNQFPAIKNYTIEISEDAGNITFLHKLIAGYADKSYGVHVAELAGLPKSVIAKANIMLQSFEDNEKLTNKKSHNLTLFDQTNNNQLSEENNKLNLYLAEIREQLLSIDPDDITPRQAHQILTKLRAEFAKDEKSINNLKLILA